MTITGVYAIIHRSSGAVYVGSSHNIVRRWGRHVSALSNGRHHSPKLLDLWLLDGSAAFTFLILEQCPREDLALREQEWMDSFASLLNRSRTAKHCPTLDPIIAAKVGASHRGQRHPPEWRAHISVGLLGHPVSEEARAKMRASYCPHPITPETRAKMIKSRQHNGWIISAETRAKIGAANHAAWQRRRMEIQS